MKYAPTLYSNSFCGRGSRALEGVSRSWGGDSVRESRLGLDCWDLDECVLDFREGL